MVILPWQVSWLGSMSDRVAGGMDGDCREVLGPGTKQLRKCL